jgi:hypothetical protein
MANRQIDPSGAYMRGYADAEMGVPRRCPYFDKASQIEYRDGYNAAKLAEKSA